MLGQGLLLMVAGTGTVFVFLCIMVVIMMGVGVYFKAHESRYLEAPPTQPRKQNGAGMQPVVAAIAVSLLRQGK